ncbi:MULTISPECIES: hypothetical protein [unclassified Rhizobium]|uniref:helix-turn-helix domain-containing protein n=1 Tax=unclassified Rhizobium TaxID=2613769 RepID=UPI0006F20CC5|nr:MULTISPECIES: hypothetical protein [unclassified Rhizobium]KQV33332.1 hypothetical protein ASC86_17310 [Rhizobium sp. Root1212]KRD22466.1 hypothetical protein ASE37_17225 [Rhizobium sp. Root268]
MITGAQCRAARALSELSLETLARLAKIDADVIDAFESKLSEPDAETISLLETTLEAAGVVFLPENGAGAGVRLKFNRSETRRIAILEGEGGIVGNDDVP